MSFVIRSSTFALGFVSLVVTVFVSSFVTTRGGHRLSGQKRFGSRLVDSCKHCTPRSSRLLVRCNTMLSGREGDGDHVNQTMLATSTLDRTKDEIPDGYCAVTDNFGFEAYENVTLISENNAFESKCSVAPGGQEVHESREVYRWIRLQAGPGKSLENVQSHQDVLSKIAETIEIQRHYGRADLYPRSWQPAKYDKLFSPMRLVPPLFNNKVKGGKSKKESHSFSVMQFNTLAEGLSCGPKAETPFRVDPSSEHQSRQKSNYGGFTRTEHPEIALDFVLRRWRLLEVLISQQYEEPGAKNTSAATNGEDLNLFDLIAMEEVDRYGGFFAPVLSLFGYQGIFVPKPRAPGARLGWYSDGCALFYKTETFELIEQHFHEYRVGTQVFVVAILRHRPSNRLVVAAVTHLKAQKSSTNEQIRTAQVAELSQHVEEVAANAATLQQRLDNEGEKGNNNNREVPILIMGDLNSDPPSVLSQGCVKRILKNHRTSAQSRRFRSAYPIDPPRNGFFTTWKTRGDDTAKRIIDYIFYTNKGVRCSHTLEMPDQRAIEADGYLPGLRYPSDHMSIAARFELL